MYDAHVNNVWTVHPKKHYILFIIASVYLNKASYLCCVMGRYEFEKEIIAIHKRFSLLSITNKSAMF